MKVKIPLLITNLMVASTIALVGLAPAVTYSQECTPPVSTQPGAQRPNGADSALYTYDCPRALWISSHYTYNPATGQQTANDPITYTYNPSTSSYDYQVWVYSAPQGNYVQVTQSVGQPPAGATVIGSPAPAVTPEAPAAGSQTISDTGAGSNNSISGDGTGAQSIANTGAESTNSITGSGNASYVTNNTNILTVANLINSSALSGNATIMQNTSGGSAISGDAQSLANVVNLLQSSSNVLGSGNVVSFLMNIDGDVNGDLLFDPATLGIVQPAASKSAGDTDIKINNSTNASINNDINLSAISGNVNVVENTKAGNATSGAAQAIANVVNLINSAVGSGKSFIGTININGNLNGDILVPPTFIDQLIATNVPTVTISTTGANSSNTIDTTGKDKKLDLTNTNDMGITNNVNSVSSSGSATSSQNTTAGNAISGNASNSITAFNLTGSKVIGTNSMLVFVNVMGKWVGLIVNAPPGATAAMYGGNVAESSVNPPLSGSLKANNDNNLQINNNINLVAQSGDANLDRNTTAGQARSGNANTAVNLLNVQNSTFSLSDWFGILFINVFGTWNGSFGIDTEAGNSTNPPQPPVPGTGVGSSTPPTPKFFRFIPSSGSESTFRIARVSASSNSSDDQGVLSGEEIVEEETDSPMSSIALLSDDTGGFGIGKLVVLLGLSILIYLLIGVIGNMLYALRRRSQS